MAALRRSPPSCCCCSVTERGESKRIGEQQGVREKERKTTVVTPRELGDREGVAVVEVEVEEEDRKRGRGVVSLIRNK